MKTEKRNSIRNIFGDINNFERFLHPYNEELWIKNPQISSNLLEDENNYYAEIDLPGIKKEEIEIKAQEDNISISYERKRNENYDKFKKHYSEISYGRLNRNFYFSQTIEKENIKAVYENGTLHLTIPKSTTKGFSEVKIE